jgi:hypothetical protein
MVFAKLIYNGTATGCMISSGFFDWSTSDTLDLTCAEDRAMLKSNPSAATGPEAR